MSLAADERQEWLHASRKMAILVNLMWQALGEEGLPEDLRKDLVVSWWTEFHRPKVEMPDIGAIFRQFSGEEDDDE